MVMATITLAMEVSAMRKECELWHSLIWGANGSDLNALAMYRQCHEKLRRLYTDHVELHGLVDL